MRIQPRKILCAIDFSEYSTMVLQYGKALAKEFDASLVLCHISPASYMVSGHITPYVDFTAIESERAQQAHEKLEQEAESLEIDSDIIVEIGNPAEKIAQLAAQKKIELVVAATYGGSGFKRYLVGSVTDRMVKILPCPLLVLHPPEDGDAVIEGDNICLERILVGCDFSKDSAFAFDYALSFAQEFQSQLYLAHVIRPQEHLKPVYPDGAGFQHTDLKDWDHTQFVGMQAKTQEEFEEKRVHLIHRIEKKMADMIPESSKSWCSPYTVVLEGAPYEALIDYGQKKKVNMIVLGIRGHGLIEKFLVGSTTDRVISQAACPVLAVRGSDSTVREKSGSETGTGLTAKDIMEQDVLTVTPETKISDTVNIFLEHHVNGLPVLDSESRLKGLLCQSDLIVQQKEIPMPPVFSMLDSFIPLTSSARQELEIEKMSAITVEQAMVKELTVADPDTPVTKVASWMVENHYYTIPVVDSGKLVGIIGKEDILKVLL